jgi:hypothetical protein
MQIEIICNWLKAAPKPSIYNTKSFGGTVSWCYKTVKKELDEREISTEQAYKENTSLLQFSNKISPWMASGWSLFFSKIPFTVWNCSFSSDWMGILIHRLLGLIQQHVSSISLVKCWVSWCRLEEESGNLCKREHFFTNYVVEIPLKF